MWRRSHSKRREEGLAMFPVVVKQSVVLPSARRGLTIECCFYKLARICPEPFRPLFSVPISVQRSLMIAVKPALNREKLGGLRITGSLYQTSESITRPPGGNAVRPYLFREAGKDEICARSFDGGQSLSLASLT
jgi:hypothetical protein